MSEARHENPSTGGRGSRQRTRRLALQALYQWLIADTGDAGLLEQFRHDPGMARANEDYFRDLVKGVMEHHEALDERLSPQLDRPLVQIDPVEHAVMLLGTYELCFHPELPYRVVINEAVELTKRFGATDSHRYVNGVLDKVARQVRASERDSER